LWPTFEHYRHHIAANLCPRRVSLARVSAGQPPQVSALVTAHRASRRSILVALPRFHFDDDQRVAVPSDQVRLAIARGKTVVASHNGVALPPQKAVRQILTAPAQS